MDQPIIEVEKLSKRYQIGVQRDSQVTLRDALARRFSSEAREAAKSRQDFWALRDVSFSVDRGEALGIIGRNGAGKSTLLKVLSQITPPTEGRITMRGRVASLLEVGTGFHPELSGRENIFLNGAILGMTRKEIAQKFDEIVEFSEVSRFLDTPVKRYSSGMYVRLAFAVAAHLQPEILIVDEVLAVGDGEFQKKCLGKMGEVSRGGRTVLFVSHNISAVASLCTKALLLKTGQVLFSGDVSEGLKEYAASVRGSGDAVRTFEARAGGTEGRIARVELLNGDGTLVDRFVMGERWVLRFEIELDKPMSGLRCSFRITTDRGDRVYHLVARDNGFSPSLPAGRHVIAASLDPLALYPGTYVLTDLWLAGRSEVLDKIPDVLSFAVEESGTYPDRDLNPNFAVVHEVANWSVEMGSVEMGSVEMGSVELAAERTGGLEIASCDQPELGAIKRVG
jgi:lipopolysaccharide transport system ATP-binding protein